MTSRAARVSVAFEQAAPVRCQRDRAFLFVHGHALDESLILEVSEIASAAARVTKIALRDHPKRADRAERPRFESIQGVVPVATMHQLAVVTAWQVEIANEHVSRIGSAIIVPVPRLTVTFSGRSFPPGDTVVRVFRELTTAASERQVLIFAIVNAIVSVA